MPGLVAGLIAWALYLAIGAAFPEEPVEEKPAVAVDAATDGAPTGTESAASEGGQPVTTEAPRFLPWRGVVVLACSAFFLAWFWGLQRLYARRHAG